MKLRVGKRAQQQANKMEVWRVAAVIPEEPRFYAVLTIAERDPRLPEGVRRSVVALRAADEEFGRWGAEVNRGERPGNLDEAIWPGLDRDDEVIRTWDLFDDRADANAA